MAQANGNGIATVPSESVHVNGDGVVQAPVKPRLSIKVPQPIELKNHVLEGFDNFDTLHSQIGNKVESVSTSILISVITGKFYS